MERFKADLDQNLKCTNSFEYSDHTPIKKILRFNNSLFMTKTLRKAIMHKSK